MNVYFKDGSFLDFRRREGHYYMYARAVHQRSGIDGEKIDFIFDTGAFLTIISRNTAVRCGFDKLPSTIISLSGFGGDGEPADFIRIPSLKILDVLVTDVPVAVPYDSESTREVLGLNVLEYFHYYIDTENDRIYFCRNLNPKPYDDRLACGQVFTASSNETISIQ